MNKNEKTQTYIEHPLYVFVRDNTGRHFFSPRVEKKSPVGDGSRRRFFASGRRIVRAILCPWATDNAREEQRWTLDFSSPSSSFSLPQLILPETDRRWSKSIIANRFQVVTGRKQLQSVVPRSSGRSAYRSTDGSECTALYERYRSVLHSLVWSD
ncbi:hypothetical protein B296_00010236 [Ensete ventricosum]|uniref:Uncharacterized protein n=1 Tax=Ensete ventricosum TaxID=4639 RepID=A0A426ZU29_ENSVE|nr:hypothetical protein B296_00010236 [Ensete ventricosum]